MPIDFPWNLILTVYLILINVVGIVIMHSDKQKAIRHEWRIPEARLFLVALLGGSLGSIIGMYAFRHKTKHWYFVVGMPAILVVQVALAIFLMIRFGR